MISYIDDKFGFVFFYPDKWTCQKEDNIISVYDAENGLGALQFSVYYVGNDNKIDLKVELKNFLENYGSIKIEVKGDFAYSIFNDDDDRAWQYWLFQKGTSLIFASYSCEIDDKGMEDELIQRILDSFTLSSVN